MPFILWIYGHFISCLIEMLVLWLYLFYYLNELAWNMLSMLKISKIIEVLESARTLVDIIRMDDNYH